MVPSLLTNAARDATFDAPVRVGPQFHKDPVHDLRGTAATFSVPPYDQGAALYG